MTGPNVDCSACGGKEAVEEEEAEGVDRNYRKSGVFGNFGSVSA
jgi:hypothetical protein